MLEDETQKPPRVPPRLKSAPKIRQIYWCDFPRDAQLPEFWKKRPVIILSKSSTLHGTVMAIPCTTQAKQDPKFAFPLRTTIDGRAGWAICDKISTIAVSRLTTKQGQIVRMPVDEFNEMLELIFDNLPKPSLAK